MKKWWLLILTLLIITSLVTAFSEEQSIQWIKDNLDTQTSTIEEASFGLLSLGLNDEISSSDTDYIIFQQRKNAQGCFPESSCNTKDTSLAALTDEAFNTNNNDLLEWIESTLTKSEIQDWYIQVQTSSTGKCTIIYDESQSKILNVNGLGKLSIDGQPGEFDWLSINTLGVNLDNPIEEIIVDCTKPTDTKIDDPGMLVSLLRITNDNEFYIYQEEQGKIVTLTINNACYSNTPNGQCNKDASFYAAWVLNILDKEITIIPYLESNAATDKDYAMLLSITGDQRYAQLLVDSQHTLGYWGNQDILTTSFAINSLSSYPTYDEDVSKAQTWLESKQISEPAENNGSYGNLLNTASVTYLVFTDGTSVNPGGGNGGGAPYCGDGIVDLDEECDDGANFDNDGCSALCELEQAESCIFTSDCKGEGEVCNEGLCVIGCTTDNDCLQSELCNTFLGICESREDDCDNDGICDFTENPSSCPSDCDLDTCSVDDDCGFGEICISGECRSTTGDSECTSNNDCSEGEICNLDTEQCEVEEGLGVIFWASLVIIIAILAIGGYFAYTKFIKKPKKPIEPSFLGSQQNEKVRPRQSYTPKGPSYGKGKTDELLERELDKSIKEAERLLKK